MRDVFLSGEATTCFPEDSLLGTTARLVFLPGVDEDTLQDVSFCHVLAEMLLFFPAGVQVSFGFQFFLPLEK